MSDHSHFSPSAAHRWMRCSFSITAPPDDRGSQYADDGTRMHEAAAKLLTGERDWLTTTGLSSEEIDVVNEYIDYVKEAAQDAELYIEQRVDFSETLGAEGCFGTVDALVVKGDTIKIIDLKTGRGVRVEPENNEQLLLYALGALEAQELVREINRIELHIVQPRLDNIGYWELSVDELRAFGERARAVVAQIVDGVYAYNPGEKTCRWCPAKATCPALSAQVSEATAMDFDDLTDVPATADDLKTVTPDRLASLFARVGLVENWCKAIREAVFAELSAGRDVPGYKLVEGKRGHRKWQDDAAAEAMLKSMRLKREEMYDFRLISPTTAEKLAKAGVIGERQWPKLKTLITQKDGGPSVAPADDPRPAISLMAKPEDFEALPPEDEEALA